MHDHELATAIRALRAPRTQAEFAAEMGVQRRTIIRWERGETAGMRLEYAQRLVELGMAPQLLFDTPGDGSSYVVADAPTGRGTATRRSVPRSNRCANPLEQDVA